MLSLREAYDQTPYHSEPIRGTHPDTLYALALMLGVAAPPPDKARVLELGCAVGGNILSIAASLPSAGCVGVDLSSAQIDAARALAKEAALPNVTFHVKDIAELGPAFGTFDYIICHGLFSWVPPAVQDKILALCRDNLSPNGIGYVSYNVFPGWKARGTLRDLMLQAAAGETIPAVRCAKARAVLDFVSACLDSGGSAAPVPRPSGEEAFKKELDQARGMPDWYLLHDFLAEFNAPCYFIEFMRRASVHELQYVGDTEFAKLIPQDLPAKAQALLGKHVSGDRMALEHYMDILRNRMFRRSVLCHRRHELRRRIEPAGMRDMRFSTPLQPSPGASADPGPAGTVFFTHPNGGGLKTADPLVKAALLTLHEHWPAALPFAQLLELSSANAPMLVSADPADAQLARAMLRCVLADIVECSAAPQRFACPAPSAPRASSLARAQARARESVSSLRHEQVKLSAAERELLARLDGKTPREKFGESAALIDALGKKALLAI